MPTKGIDVSGYQGDIDFNLVKQSGVEFVIIKAGEWYNTADNFEKNYLGAKNAGLHIGFYWFSDAQSVREAKKEADACVKALQGKQFDYPVFFDLENKFQLNKGKEFCSAVTRAFCEKLEEAGYYTGLYASTSTLDNLITDDIKEKYPVWVADWRGYCGYKGKYGVWQYGVGNIPGIDSKIDLDNFVYPDVDYPSKPVQGGADLDYGYEDYPSIIKSGDWNNYPKTNPECNVANSLDIRGAAPVLSGERWFLIDSSCEFTLETLPYAYVNIYLVGGGEDGAEWFRENREEEVFAVGMKSRGGCVLKKQIYIEGNPSCKAVIAESNDFTGTALQIGNDIYKCNDDGYIQRNATSSSNAKIDAGGNFNADNGENGVNTPYGYVGSSGGGGGAYSIQNYQLVTVYAGKGGAGAGSGGNVKQNGTDAVNYGCGGGAAGFGGFPSDGDTVETHAGKGMKGCIIFEILDGGACEDSSDNSGNNDNCNCCPTIKFTCPDNPDITSSCLKETDYKLEYDGSDPIITKTINSEADGCCDSSNNENSGGSECDKNCCGSMEITYGNNCNSSCCCCDDNFVGNRRVRKNGCVYFDPSGEGENWLLYDKSGDYTLEMENDENLIIYLVGGGQDGTEGIYYNNIAYGGDGGKGGFINVIQDISVPKGTLKFTVKIGDRNDFSGTSIIINNQEYCCNGTSKTITESGTKGICGFSKSENSFILKNGGNGANGYETPYGYVGSSGGGGGTFSNNKTALNGKGGFGAGDGGYITEYGKSTKGLNAENYGCGGGGGAASDTSYCEGGKGMHGCVIISW